MFTPQAAIFDLDGTLLDSMWIWKKLDEEFLAERGFAMSQDYTDAIKSMSWEEGARYTIDRYHLSETPQQVIETWFAMSADFYKHKVKMKPFAKEYLFALHEAGIPLAIATSMEPKENIDIVLEANGIRSLFRNITLSSEVPSGKSAPDIYHLCASRLGVEPSDCAVYEDILTAILSAKKGGFQTVGIYDTVSDNDWKEIQKTSTLAVISWKDLL